MKSNEESSWFFFKSREVKVGNVGFGGGNPIRIQSMTNTPTDDISATVAQCKHIFDTGADLVRITARNISEAKILSEIRKQLNESGYSQPLAADIHFNPAIAMEAARRVEKIRINPGNFVDLFPKKLQYSDTEYNQELDEIRKTVLPLISVCRENGTAVRIGINGGSLNRRFIDRYGNTTRAMVESAVEFIRIFHDEQFHNLVISIKASDVKTMIHANRLLAQYLIDDEFHYPIHLGVTEAGEGEDGRMKSAAGIGSLLMDGIGDTIRVSLTEAPEKEIPVAAEIIESARKNAADKHTAKHFFSIVNPFGHFINKAEAESHTKPEVCAEADSQAVSTDINALRKYFIENQNKELSLHWNPESISVADFSIVAGSFLTDGCGNKIQVISALENETYREKALDLLQITGRRISKASFTSCPSCGRTTYDIENLLKEIKTEFSCLKGIHFAVMGCIVNGPGEMAGAKYGILGSKPDHVDIWVDGKPVLKNIHQSEALKELKIIVAKNEQT
ncbi:MAG: 4-hydroxy-3-methylbut-2-en-1-yl diphosphate synthase [Bacteroidetes bacterium GWF2_43_63]|nr:MAG: 4-hydroxy-3-methylbut-2-en-1-yl diphosphate synthase [Bacteroidetes bacterium GWE2_42_42]OFY55125.1 MAG: 4-hydroxy-3-methylbut-2-en-1-yl diphosphate synthase [Bacteroidetes bacterium GWF2_43_63]HBG70256.1 4-hydroxy-3-methylbut-2-en-1-yl diphosphate synthase [Bacteroidales bacterium]HCB63072.1 4-hydroxy-3-methylbut-2-en-1-yl diphosphate synthase [Bacteroidales bacterium]HCY22709.1 4-hydroxy-3-methylbut-2-en-1-yl diphosphate synthase [Bacteroidales bacterium]